MKLDDKFSTTFKIAWQRNVIDDYIYILDYDTNEFVVYEDVAKDIWMKIQENLNMRQIINYIVENYDGTKYDLVKADVFEFVEKNIKMGYLKYERYDDN